MEIKNGKGFTIVGDLEAKATLAAITDGENKVEICITGNSRDILSLLVPLFCSATECVAGVSDSDSAIEKYDKTARVGALVIEAVGAFFTKKYGPVEEEVDE